MRFDAQCNERICGRLLFAFRGISLGFLLSLSFFLSFFVPFIRPVPAMSILSVDGAELPFHLEECVSAFFVIQHDNDVIYNFFFSI